MSIQKGPFSMWLFSPIESKSDVHFSRQSSDKSDNPKKVLLSGVFSADRRKWILDLDSTGQKP